MNEPRPFSADKLLFNRRSFLKASAFATAGLTFARLPVMAGPFTRKDFDKLVPADKKLRPEWVKSLTARGARTVYRGMELRKIGMPVGGITCGQLYLGGDGKLWHWDIFNQPIGTGDQHYAQPLSPSSPVEQGFALRLTQHGKTQMRPLDQTGWNDISFIGEYPIGYVVYADAGSPVSVSLEAFSPFIPLNVDDSSLPATVMEFTVKNTSAVEVEGEVAGWLENAICLYSGQKRDGIRRTCVARRPGLIFLDCSAEDVPPGVSSKRPDIVFEDFESETYRDWVVTGTAFGGAPVEAAKMPAYQGEVGAKGKRLVNSHASASGSGVTDKDAATGRLTSPRFTIERNYITFLIGGGDHKGRTCMNLLVDEKVVRSATGAANNRLKPMSWDVRQWAGRPGQLVIVDDDSGPWGNIGVDDIVFSDRPREPVGPFVEEADFGTMGLALLDPQPGDIAKTSLPGDAMPAAVFSAPAIASEPGATQFGQKLAGSIGRKFKLSPGKSVKVTFVLTWFFPNLRKDPLPPGRFYATKFDSAQAVAVFVAKNFDRLASQTRLWHDTWYDSTLPFWFLDRTHLNISILATSTAFRFASGRFYGMEGVGCCDGTCTHVWQYEQAMGRLFPELDRLLRERADFDPAVSFKPDGMIDHRGEFHAGQAVDGQAGTILRARRDHQVSADNDFLKRNYASIKKAMRWLIAQDGNADGILEGAQHNTLDAEWYGPVAWLSGLYLASLRAAEEMAGEMGDDSFAAECRVIAEAGRKNMVARLFNGEYFINLPDPKNLDKINSGSGCEIDQVFGQGWAFQAGLGRVLPEKETRAALQSLWRYNFSPDVGPYREVNKPGRWYAMSGEAGLLMCTFPKTDWDYENAKGKGPEGFAGYFNECMNGFEHQVAGHMIWEGMVTEGLAVERALHDRYHASRRNPWNEVECGDHYARSMASYGVFIAACGFEYHGPKGHIGFSPRLTPENFKAPFTAAEGWGTISQERSGHLQTNRIELKRGGLRLKTLTFELPLGVALKATTVTVGPKQIPATAIQTGQRVQLTLVEEISLQAAEIINSRLEFA